MPAVLFSRLVLIYMFLFLLYFFSYPFGFTYFAIYVLYSALIFNLLLFIAAAPSPPHANAA